MTSPTQAATAAMLARIQALRAKTTDRGCTEQEAMAAAAKVAELLDRHSLSISDLEQQAHPCERAELRTERSRAGPLDDCGPAVAAFFDCHCWLETRDDGRLNHVFFGLPADVQAALHLMELVGRAFETEGNRFRAGKAYTQGRGGRRRALHTSFMRGLSQGIQARLSTTRAVREAASRALSGRDVVTFKSSVVAAELAKLALQFRSSKPVEQPINEAAYDAGHAVGEHSDVKLELDQGR